MNVEKVIRKEARELLSKGNWSSALAVFFILFASVLLILFVQSVLVLGIEAVFTPAFDALAEIDEIFSTEVEGSIGSTIILLLSSTAAWISYALGFLFIFPLYCGVKRYFYKLTKGDKPGINEVFHYIAHDLKKSLAVGGRYGILCVLKLLPCMAVPYILVAVIASGELSVFVNSLLIISAVATGIGGLALWILWTSKGFLAIYLFIENDSLPAAGYAKESARILNGQLNTSVRKLMYSFFGWFMFALTGVGLLYFVPYLEATLATSAKWLINLDKEVC